MNEAKKKGFLRRHWMDILTVTVLAVLLCLLAYVIYERFRFAKKWDLFLEYFVENRGYNRLLTGLQNTAIIAVAGLLIGFVIDLISQIPQDIRHRAPSFKQITTTSQIGIELLHIFPPRLSLQERSTDSSS